MPCSLFCAGLVGNPCSAAFRTVAKRLQRMMLLSADREDFPQLDASYVIHKAAQFVLPVSPGTAWGELLSDQQAGIVSTALQRMRHLATGAAYSVAGSLPAPARARLRDVVMWSDRRRPPPIEDWSRPLIGGRSGHEAASDVLNGTAGGVAGPGVVGPTRPHSPAETTSVGLHALRCLIVSDRLDFGGVAEVAASLALRLPDHGLRTAVLHITPTRSAPPGGSLARMLQLSGVEVHETDESGAASWVQEWRPDVISGHCVLPSWVLNIAESAGVPYVEVLHGMQGLFVADWAAESARAANHAAIVTVSEIVRRQYLAGNRRFPPGRIITIANSVDDERRPAGDRASAREQLGLAGEYLFVSLARYSYEKNLYGLVAAFVQLADRRPEAHLLIAGQPHDVRYYRQVLRLRDSLPCRDRVHLREHVAAPGQLLAAADGFALDSFCEGGPIASMEALCAGVPVVLSDVGGAREQIGGDPARGYLVTNPLGDPLNVNMERIAAAQYKPQVNRDEFADAMERLVVGRDDYLAGRKELAVESAERFSADACLARHAAVLRAAATGADLPGSGSAFAAAPDHRPASGFWR